MRLFSSIPPGLWWARLAADETPARVRRRVYVFAAFVALSCEVAFRACDDILRALHPAGGLSYGIGSLPDLGFHTPSRAVAHDAVTTWYAAADSAGLTGPLRLVAIYLLVDLVFIAAYGTLFAVVLRRGELRLSKPQPAQGSAHAARRRIVGFAFQLVPLLMLADVVENVATALLVPKLAGKDWIFSFVPIRGSFWVLVVAAALKWILVLLVLGAFVLVLGTFLLDRIEVATPTGTEERRSALAEAFTTLATLRVQAVLLVVFALFLHGPTAREQVADVMLRWNFSGDTVDGVAAVVLTGWFCTVTYAVSTRLLSQAGGERSPVSLGWVLALAAALTIGGGVALNAIDKLEGVLVLGIIGLVIFVLSFAVGKIEATAADDPKPSGAGTGLLPPLLATLPLVILGVAVLSAGLSEVIYSGNLRFFFLVAVGLVLQLLGWTAFVRLCERWDQRLAVGGSTSAPHQQRIIWASLVAIVFITVWIWLDPWGAGGRLGVLGAFAAFAVLLSLAGYGALRLEQRFRPPACFRVIGLKRIPIFALVIVAFVAASSADKGGYHNIRTIQYAGGTNPSHPGISFTTAWTRWRDAQKLPATEPRNGTKKRTVVPLVFIAAEGGGIRAAFWTARVLDCIYATVPANCGGDHGSSPNPYAANAPPPFVESGVSGGSLGLVEYLAHDLGEVDDNDPDWVVKRAGNDQLAATAAWTLFVDIPNALLRIDPSHDRAAVLETAWERQWDGKSKTPNPMRRGFLAALNNDDRLPILLLNGTSVQDGCRVNTSVITGDIDSVGSGNEELLRDCLTLQAYEQENANANKPRADWTFGATQDLGELLCSNQDVRLSTAALLSARFPFVTPAGRVPHCKNPKLATFVVDGGYFDTSASSPIVELWTKLERLVSNYNRKRTGYCVVPLMLQIDNHYTEPRGIEKTNRSPELLVPLEAVKAARDARENGARQTAALAFDGAFGPWKRITIATAAGPQEVDRYAHIYPRAHPGTAAPLGWALSEAAMDDLTDQLHGDANQQELAKVASWFDPRLRCQAK
jgi:hypothetical protein